MTSNLEMRLFAHNHLPKGWTKNFRPWEVLYKEEFQTKPEALARERELKGFQGREFIHNLLKYK
jgi:putative endonuclease